MNNTEPHFIRIKKTARYYSSGSLDKSYRQICFCLHGYGQLAQFFIRKFNYSELNDILFIAPEGFHRFYLKNTAGRVGATWMTKEDRLNDISDYVGYLDLVLNEVISKLEKPSKMGVFGFSQGVATACRWVAQSNYSFDYLINWAGAFPPDLDFEKAHEKMKVMPITLAVGDTDEFISEIKLQEHLSFLQQHQFNPRVMRFSGKHDIYKEPLLQIFEMHC